MVTAGVILITTDGYDTATRSRVVQQKSKVENVAETIRAAALKPMNYADHVYIDIAPNTPKTDAINTQTDPLTHAVCVIPAINSQRALRKNMV